MRSAPAVSIPPSVPELSRKRRRALRRLPVRHQLRDGRILANSSPDGAAPPHGGITCFVNVMGLGLQFAALGALAHEKVKASGIGWEIPTDPDSLVPISVLGNLPFILGIKSSLPPKTLQEFEAYVKANPGKLNYASAGVGGIGYLVSVLYLKTAGLDAVHVPYKGNGLG